MLCKLGPCLHTSPFQIPFFVPSTFTVSVWFIHWNLSKQCPPTVQMPKSRREKRGVYKRWFNYYPALTATKLYEQQWVIRWPFLPHVLPLRLHTGCPNSFMEADGAICSLRGRVQTLFKAENSPAISSACFLGLTRMLWSFVRCRCRRHPNQYSNAACFYYISITPKIPNSPWNTGLHMSKSVFIGHGCNLFMMWF